MNTEKNPSQKMVFVHADLDLYGLSPYEFRLYAHIARRGKCYSSLKKMAKICRMSVRKAQYALKTLENQNLIKKRIRKGTTDIYEVTNRSEWKSPEYDSDLEDERNKVKDKLLLQQSSEELEPNID